MDDVEFMESEDAAGARFIDLLVRGRSLAAEVRELRAELESVRKTHALVYGAGIRLGAQVRRVRELLADEGRHRIQMDGNWVKWSDVADAIGEEGESL